MDDGKKKKTVFLYFHLVSKEENKIVLKMEL